MKFSRFIAYASLIIIVAGGAIWYKISDYYGQKAAQKTETADIVMYKNKGCQCCEKWVQYMRGSGFSVESNNADNLMQIKSQNGIPNDMSACHTAIVGDYVVEGHVPVEDIVRLLREQPDAKGIAVPGMPASSPGMNTALNDPYKVYLLKNDGSTEVFSQH